MKGNSFTFLIQLRERRRLGLSQPENYGGKNDPQIQAQITPPSAQNYSKIAGNQGSPINNPDSMMKQFDFNGSMVNNIPTFDQQQMLMPPNQMIAYPTYMPTNMDQMLPPLYQNQNLDPNMGLYNNQLVQQYPNSIQSQPQVVIQSNLQNQRLNRFHPNMNQIQQHSQQMLYDYYQKNVNSQLFNQRSRSHQQIDPKTLEMKQQYAKILEFQVKEHEVMKARKRSEEKSLSPQVYENSQKYINPHAINTSNIVESIPIPYSHRQYPPEDYKDQLLQQIEEKRKIKVASKQKKLEDEMKDELRVKRELQELNMKYQIEVGIIKPPENQQQQQQQYNMDQDSPSNEIIENQNLVKQDMQNRNLNAYQKQTESPIRSANNMQQQMMEMNEYADFNQYQVVQDTQQLDPIKKQLQVQLNNFQKDIQKLQKQQKEMLQNYKKEVELIQEKKESVIKDVKNTQETEMKRQIDQLQKALKDVQKKSSSFVKSQHEKSKGSMIEQSELPSNKYQENQNKRKRSQSPPISVKNNNHKNKKKKINIKNEQKHSINEDNKNKSQDMEEENEKTLQNLQNIYSNQGQIIITPIAGGKSRQNNQNQQSSLSSKKEGNGNVLSLAQMMQGKPYQDVPLSTLNEMEQLVTPRGLSMRAKMKKLEEQKQREPVQIPQPIIDTQKDPDQRKIKPQAPPKKKIQSQINPVMIPTNEENENLSITNLLKKMKSLDKRDKSPEDLRQAQTPSILKKQSSLLRRQSGVQSQKSVRINDAHNFQKDPLQIQADEQFLKAMQNEFFMGQEVPTLADDAQSEYIDQTRLIEKQYYEQVLKPDKVKQNIESHQVQDKEMPGTIGGIKINANPEMDENQIQEFIQLPGENDEQDPAEMSRFTNFLFQKNLVNQQEIEDHQVIQKQLEEEKQQEIELTMKYMKSDQPQYQLKEKNYNEIGYKEMVNHDPKEMSHLLNDIKRIVNENSKISEDFFSQNKESSNQGYIQFNKTFQRNLQKVEDIFEIEKKQRIAPIKTMVNISMLEDEESKDFQLAIPPKFSDRDNENHAMFNYQNISRNQQEMGQGSKYLTKSEDVMFSYENKMPIMRMENEDENQTPSDMRQSHQDFQDNNDEQILNLQPQQFHLINYLMSQKPSSSPGTPKDSQQIHEYLSARRLINEQTQFTHLNELSQQTPKHFDQVIKNQIMPMVHATNQIQQILKQPQVLTSYRQNIPPVNRDSNMHSNKDLRQSAQQFSHNLQMPAVTQYNPLQIQRKKTQPEDKQNRKPPLPTQQQRLRHSEPQNNNNLNQQQQYQFQTMNNQYEHHLTPQKQNVSSSNQLIQQSQQNQVPSQINQKQLSYIQQYQQPQQIDIHHSQESLTNVFTENSQINEQKIPVQIYNQYFKEEVPVNKIYDRNDPFLININLRQKLVETNQMIHVDNQNLLDKIKKLGKSIKPVTYGYPYIDLTKTEVFNEQEHNEAKFRSEVYSQHLKNEMDKNFPGYQQQQNTEEQKNEDDVNNNPVVRYLNYNFNGERGIDLKQKKMSDKQKLEGSKVIRLFKYAQTFNSSLVNSIVQDKVKEDLINLGQIQAKQAQAMNYYDSTKQINKQQDFLEYIKEEVHEVTQSEPKYNQDFSDQLEQSQKFSKQVTNNQFQRDYTHHDLNQPIIEENSQQVSAEPMERQNYLNSKSSPQTRQLTMMEYDQLKNRDQQVLHLQHRQMSSINPQIHQLQSQNSFSDNQFYNAPEPKKLQMSNIANKNINLINQNRNINSMDSFFSEENIRFSKNRQLSKFAVEEQPLIKGHTAIPNDHVENYNFGEIQSQGEFDDFNLGGNQSAIGQSQINQRRVQTSVDVQEGDEMADNDYYVQNQSDFVMI
ncbi:UNKNOWN [Stylonychia lemnae]|uniref:Uncharacterized protein n=1 Tax=Stylonychia lemnae TaxID=5949 RepID=A0A078B912_STYLE|nr:UNKNOWN [Stylonychia lemnae]|eukprot:CDW89767.1 UNKNOWN [Stylonychia lemnae]